MTAETQEEVHAQPVAQENGDADPKAANGQKEKKKREYKEPKQCDPPNRKEFEEKKEALQSQIDEKHIVVNNISRVIDQQQAVRQKYRDERKALLDALAASKTSRTAMAEEVAALRTQMEEIEKKRATQRAFLQQHKDGLKFTNVADLDAAVAKIDMTLATSQLPQQTMQKLLNDSRFLKMQRLQVLHYSEQLKMVQMNKADPNALRAARDAKLKATRDQRETEKKTSERLNELRKLERAANAEVEAKIKERKGLSSEMYKLQNARDSLQRKFTNQEWDYHRWTEFCKYQKRQQLREERKKQREQAEEGIEHDEDSGEVIVRHHYQKELDQIGELTRYLNFFIPKDQQSADDATSAADDAAARLAEERAGTFKGKVAAVRKRSNSIEEEFSGVLGTKKKAPKKKSQQKKDRDEHIQHIPDAFSRFKALGMEPPLLQSQLADALKVLEEKREHYQNAPPPKKKEKKEDNKKAAKEDGEDDKAEETERAKNRRKSLLMSDAEKARRIQEAEEESAESERQMKEERRKSVLLAVSLAESERQRRLQEAAESSAENDKERKRNQQLADNEALAEQRRRVSEKAKEMAATTREEQAERLNNQRRASNDLDKEQARRISASGKDLKTQLDDAEKARTA